MIFNAKHFHVRAVKDRDLIFVVIGLIVIDVVLVTIWETVSPFERHLSSDAPVQNAYSPNQLDVFSRERCNSPNFSTWTIVMLVYKGAVLLVGFLLALRVRKINIKNLNDSRLISVAVYNGELRTQSTEFAFAVHHRIVLTGCCSCLTGSCADFDHSRDYLDRCDRYSGPLLRLRRVWPAFPDDHCTGDAVPTEVARHRMEVRS